MVFLRFCVSERPSEVPGAKQVKLPQNTSAVLCTFIIQPHTFSSRGPVLHPPCPLAKLINPKLLLRDVATIVVLVCKNWVRSHPGTRQELVVNIQRVSAVIFSHRFLASSGQTGILKTSWVGGYICNRWGRPLPAVRNIRQLHPEVSLSSSGWLSQQLLVKLHHLKAMKSKRKEWRESRKPLSIAFVSSSPFLPVAIVLSVPGNWIWHILAMLTFGFQHISHIVVNYFLARQIPSAVTVVKMKSHGLSVPVLQA